MATSVIENFTKKSYHRSPGSLTMVRAFTVSFGPTDFTLTREPYEAAIAVGIPAYGAEHPDIKLIYVNDKIVNVSDRGPHYFEVIVTYSSIGFMKNNCEIPVSLFGNYEEVSYFPVASSEMIDKSIADPKKPKAITNSSGESYATPINRDFTCTGMRIIKYSLTYNPEKIEPYNDSVNKNTFRGRAPNTVLFKGLTADPIQMGTIDCWKKTYELYIRNDGWKRRILDEGYNERIDGKLVPIVDDKTGEKVTVPQLLNGKGRKLAPGAEPVYNKHVIFEEKDLPGL